MRLKLILSIFASIAGLAMEQTNTMAPEIPTLLRENIPQDALDLFDNMQQQGGGIAEIINRYNEDGLSLLHRILLSSYVDEKLIKVLLDYGANPNLPVTRDYRGNNKGGYLVYRGYTAAHIAVRMGLPIDILKLLLAYGTDFQIADKGGWTPLRIAKDDHPSAQDFLRSTDKSNTDNDVSVLAQPPSSAENESLPVREDTLTMLIRRVHNADFSDNSPMDLRGLYETICDHDRRKHFCVTTTSILFYGALYFSGLYFAQHISY